MTRVVLSGVSGGNPLGYFCALGLLRVVSRRNPDVRLGFLPDGAFHPFVDGIDDDLAVLVANDAELAAGKQPWSLEYSKAEKRGTKTVADLKPPPTVFVDFLRACIEAWLSGDDEAVAFATAFATSVAVDGKGNTKPTAFHFTAAQQQFLDTVEKIRTVVTPEWASRSLFLGNSNRPGPNLRWDPAAERNWALMANDPNEYGTSVDAPAEWLAFRGLPLFPTFPRGARIITTAVDGRGDEMKLTWPLWTAPVSLKTIRSALQLSWTGAHRERAARGVFAVCTSAIRRTPQGFGNFGPATIAT